MFISLVDYVWLCYIYCVFILFSVFLLRQIILFIFIINVYRLLFFNIIYLDNWNIVMVKRSQVFNISVSLYCLSFIRWLYLAF